MRHFSRWGLTLSVVASALLTSCERFQALSPPDSSQKPTVPAFIYYHAEGTLAHLVYRTTFGYNERSQLQAIKGDVQLGSPDSLQYNVPWVQFGYTNDQMTQVTLRGISHNLDSAYYEPKPARFELTYAGQTVNARLVIDNQVVQTTRFGLDSEGYPQKVNVTLGKLVLDSDGHIDYRAEAARNKAAHPDSYSETLEQHYDQSPNVFAQSKEYQLLAALLACTNRSVGSVTGLVALDNALTRNNLQSQTVQYCNRLTGVLSCNTARFVSETQRQNTLGFPTLRRTPAGAMGNFVYSITYH